eukprot:scaffold15124_cov75-Phaeocystis_antarctica.AAC.1
MTPRRRFTLVSVFNAVAGVGGENCPFCGSPADSLGALPRVMSLRYRLCVLDTPRVLDTTNN